MTAARVVVAGGGITGLAAAFTLRQEAARHGRAIEVTVLDAADQPGGHARTIVEDGFAIERGPNGFLDRGAETMALIAELNLGDRVVEAKVESTRRLILNGGALRHVPESPPALLTSDALGWGGTLRLLRAPWAASGPRESNTARAPS